MSARARERLRSLEHGIWQEWTTYARDPAEDVGVEADVILGHVEATLHEDVLLESAAVVFSKMKKRQQGFRSMLEHQRRGQRGAPSMR